MKSLIETVGLCSVWRFNGNGCLWQERYEQSMDAGEESGQDAMDWEKGKTSWG